MIVLLQVPDAPGIYPLKTGETVEGGGPLTFTSLGYRLSLVASGDVADHISVGPEGIVNDQAAQPDEDNYRNTPTSNLISAIPISPGMRVKMCQGLFNGGKIDLTAGVASTTDSDSDLYDDYPYLRPADGVTWAKGDIGYVDSSTSKWTNSEGSLAGAYQYFKVMNTDTANTYLEVSFTNHGQVDIT